MGLYLDKNTFDSLLLDMSSEAVICENFTYLINNLKSFVDTGLANNHKKKPELIGGARRVRRGENSEKIGYKYRTAATKSKITKRGTKLIKAFGTDVLVEEWSVSHGDVSDPELGEVYPKQEIKKGVVVPRGPYTCLITARAALQKKSPTRVYVQCNCEDFKTTFYEKLNDQDYTNPQSLPKSTGAKQLAPAICKHLYAIYYQYYEKLVKELEADVPDSSPVLFGNPPGGTTPTTSIPTQPVEATNREEAIKLIRDALRAEYEKHKNNVEAYKDTRSRKAGGGRYHLYMFNVVLVNGRIRAIAYRNRQLHNPTNTGTNAVLLTVPGNPKIWNFFNTAPAHQILWNLIKELPEMSTQLKKKAEKLGGIGVYMEANEPEILVSDMSYLPETRSSILASISELN